jgi:hypothetical protein
MLLRIRQQLRRVGRRSKALLALALLLLGCDGTETGNPSATLELRMRGHSSKPEVASAGAGSGALAIERAQVTLDRLELVGCGQTGSVAASDLAVDLLADPAYELLFDTSVIDYCGLRVGVSSVDITAARSDGLPVELASTLAMELELVTSPPGTPFDASRLILGFDLGVWFDTIDVHGAPAGTDGVVRLDAMSNTALLTSFEARTNLALGLFLDNDADGQLDADELVPVATPN